MNPHWILEQINAIKFFQFTNYEKLLYSQLTNPGVLAYFNAFKTTESNLNENLGRELLELYTVGEGNFSEEDVKNTALVLTGLVLDKKNNIRQSEKFHFRGETKILGKKKFFDLKSLVNWLVQQPSTAENVVKRFGNFLIGEDIQKENLNHNLVPIIIITDPFKEKDYQELVDNLLELDSVNKIRSIRIEPQ